MTGSVAIHLLFFLVSMCTEFEEATDLLSVDPGASTISISAPGTAAAAAASSSDVRLNLSDDEENQQESSGVCLPSQFTHHRSAGS